MPKLKSFTALVIALSVTAAVAIPAAMLDRPVVIYNATDSLPHGWYLVVPKTIYDRGDLVVFPVPVGPMSRMLDFSRSRSAWTGASMRLKWL